MLLSPVVLIVLILAAVGLRRTLLDLKGRVARTETALANLEAQLLRLNRLGSAPPEQPAAQPWQQPPSPQTVPPPEPRATVPPPAPEPKPEPATPQVPRRAGLGDGPPRSASVPPVSASPQFSAPTPLPPAPQPEVSLEEMLGAHWAVYAGGLALALGGIFLVRYSIEAGLIGPGVRVMLGALLAAALIGLGERFRRSELKLGLANLPDAHIPSVLTAAGTAVAFGTIYAAHALYGFIGPAAAFTLLGAVGLATMLAAALHGPALAGLGLVGSYATPLLVSSQTPAPWPVVLYLTAVAGAAYLLARARRWLWLAWTAVGGAVLWCLAFALQIEHSAHVVASPWLPAAMALVLLQAGLAAAFIAIEPHLGTSDDEAQADVVSSVALAVLAFAGLLVQAATPFAHPLWLVFPVALMVLFGFTAWVSAPAAGAAIVAAAVGLGTMLLWPQLNAAPDSGPLQSVVARLFSLPENASTFLVFAALFSLSIALSAAARLWRGRTLKTRVSGRYVLAATVPPLLALVLAYARVTRFDASIPFAAAALLLGSAFAFAASHSLGAENRDDVNRDSAWLITGAFAAAALAALSLAFVFSLSRGYLTVAFALAALGTAYVASVRDVPLLRYAVTALGLVVLGRVAWEPRIMGAEIGRLPVLNWLLAGYGIPALAFAQSSRLLRARADDTAVRLTDGLAVLFAGLFVVFQLHHMLNGGDLTAPIAGHLEQGLLAVTALGFTHVLTRLDLARANPVFYFASLGFAAISVVLIAFGLGIDANPYFTDEPVKGMAVVNSLIPAYLLPGAAALYVARHARGVRPDWYVTAASVLGLLLVFGFVTLEVRQAFHGARIGMAHGVSGPETWAMTVAWLALGVASLAYGLWRGSLEARFASAVLVVMSSLKVVLVDLAGVSGLWRALSFLCLGAVLIGIGLVYQRLVFAKPAGGTKT